MSDNSIFMEPNDSDNKKHGASIEELYQEVASIHPFDEDNKKDIDIDDALNVLRRDNDSNEDIALDEDIENMKKKLDLQ